MHDRYPEECLSFQAMHITELSNIQVPNEYGHCFVSSASDPWILVEAEDAISYLVVELVSDLEYYCPGDVLRIYYSDGESGFSEDKSISVSLDKPGRQSSEILLPFNTKFLRIDLTERKGRLPITSLRVSGYPSFESYFRAEIPHAEGDGVVILTHELSNTGAPILALNLAKELAKAGRSVVCLYMGECNLAYKDSYDAFRVPLIPLFFLKPTDKEVGESALHAGVYRVLRCLKSLGYRFALLNTIVSGRWAGIFKSADFAVTTLIHETAETIKLCNWESMASEVAMFSDSVVFPCDNTLDGFAALVHEIKGRFLIRPQGLYHSIVEECAQDEADDFLRKLDIKPDDIVVLGSGSINLRKAPDLFVSAAIGLRDKIGQKDRLRAIWCGEGSKELSDWLELQIAACGCSQTISFLPFLPAKYYNVLLNRANAFWSTSRSDTYPSVVLEAMGKSVPVFAFSGASGVDSILANDRGTLVENFSTEGLAFATKLMIDEKDVFREKANNAFRWIQSHFAFSDYVNDLWEIMNHSAFISTEYVYSVLSDWTKDNESNLPIGKAVPIEEVQRVASLREKRMGGFSGRFRGAAMKRRSPVLLDVSEHSDNIDDQIVMEYCNKICSSIFDSNSITRVPTHVYDASLERISNRLQILCGTNLISTHMENSVQWVLPHDLSNLNNLCLLGVGMQDIGIEEPFSRYTADLLTYLLDNGNLHSVRDGFTKDKLAEIGITNVVNTACPTMWNLTSEHCRYIPPVKSKQCVTTVTCHAPDAETDRYVLETLLEEYDRVFLWLQGPYDYSRCIRGVVDPTRFVLLPPSLKELDKVLENESVDYVGMRLHAGIRALNQGRRSLIITVDNRARHISQDTGLPTMKRKSVREELREWINGEHPTNIVLPEDAIGRWKDQFR